jgi:hypothetical protein
MKLPLDIPLSWIQILVSAIGAIILSQGISFGWPSKTDPELSSHIAAICLCLAGLGLFFVGNFIRQMLAKLKILERELARLKAGEIVA